MGFRCFHSHGRPQASLVNASRIILLRHGESMGNLSDLAYVTTPDWKIPLTATGVSQAQAAGARIKELIQGQSLYVYVSPYLRARQTLDEVRTRLAPEQIIAVREEPRISEQQFGNFQVSFSGVLA
jgi:broad specificity phosphatase PhoE